MAKLADPSHDLSAMINLVEAVDGVAETATLIQGGSAGVARVVTNTDGRITPTNANEVLLLTIDAVSGWFRLQLPGVRRPETTLLAETGITTPAGIWHYGSVSKRGHAVFDDWFENWSSGFSST